MNFQKKPDWKFAEKPITNKAAWAA